MKNNIWLVLSEIIIGVIIRFLICLLFVNTSVALFMFGIVNFIDFYSRSIVYRLVLSKFYKEEKLSIKRNGDETLSV